MAFTIYVIHHSHTDIGYTDCQEQIEANHIYYIRHALRILDHAHTDRPDWLGFVWQCEGWWTVEKFLETAEEKEKTQFWGYVRSGEIGLSANYMNMTELIDRRILEEYLERAGKRCAEEGIRVPCAMTADVDGYSWGYADALIRGGAKNLLSFLHTHHGRYPLFKKQTPFWWEAPSGKEILVWLGDHYLLGNELGLDGHWAQSYTCAEDGMGDMEAGDGQKAEARIANFVETMKRQGYPYDFTVTGVSGFFTDNACPSPLILEFIKAYNQKHGRDIRFCMVTLEQFFERLREEEKKTPFPRYRGDWTDWWADGVGSTPVHVQHFREAQRRVGLAERLWARETGDVSGIEKRFGELQKEAKENLMVYAEHTWGHSASVVEPHAPGVNCLELRKGLYAQRGHEAAGRALLLIAGINGATPALYSQGTREFAVINPEDVQVREVVSFEVEENLPENAEIFRVSDGRTVPFQTQAVPRGTRIYFTAEVKGGEKESYRLRELPAKWRPTAGVRTPFGADTVCDMESELWKDGKTVSPWRIENDWLRIRLDEEKGVAELYDKEREMSLIRKDAAYPAFTPIYEHTPVPDGNQCDTRKRMGRNRKSAATERYAGKLRGIRVLESGALFDRAELSYELPGTKICLVILTVYKEEKKLDVDLRLHKESMWDPENLYLALPFTAGDGESCWMEKGGCVFRPRIDQLPGSCTDFYLIQNGVWFTGKEGTVLIATPDTPLIMMGEIKAHPILLAGENKKNSDMVYSWVMNNFWETNFKVDLGGFHQYHYRMLLTEKKEPEEVRRLAEQSNTGLFTFQRTMLEDEV